ncbi:metallophosphoesterase family protein [Thermincola potens]|uniref:Phosphoesterase n=1 Tax=Thermincola potens (strain JR) TaxID=635013 RepID=D5XB34_THEPJ|nr:metallophosphoesterase family protein [Thermincola potens]ADG81354.1 phosphodiesterase, MJ0936 family [Thermincola potens JR]
MRVAVISDIHANLEALRAVLTDIVRQKVDKVYCTGDLVGYGPFPNEVIDLIREKRISTVMGNYDDAVGFMRFICGCDYKDEKAQALGEKSIMWTKEHTTEENKEFLRNLPAEIRFTAGERRVLLVHGSPHRLNEYIYEDTPADYLQELMEKADTDVLVCGHTHKPFHLTVQGKHIINAGSVGKPKHGDPRATYVIISFAQDVAVEIRKVAYDFEATARAIEQSGLPPEFAGLIRRGIA